MSTGSDFEVVTERREGMLFVVPSGELDIATVGRLSEAIDQRGGDDGVVLDLGRLTFLDTSGLQLVVEVNRRAQTDGWPLRLIPGPAPVQRVFQIAGLEGVLPFGGRDGTG